MNRIPLWRLNAAMWSVFAILFFCRALLHLDPLPAVGLSLFHLCFCLTFTGLLSLTYRRLLKKTGGFGVETAGWIIILSLAATILQSLAAHALISLTGWHDHAWSLLDLWLMRVMFFWLIYMVWSLLYFWIKAEQSVYQQVLRAAEARVDTQRMELQMLRSQLDPHFLFNALNGIATVVQTDSPPAASMVRELADYLRYSLDHQHDTMVPLSRELEAMMGYLHIEQARFSEELHIEITTDEESRRRQIPCFLLLPLVENAVKHSFSDTEPPWHVNINAEARGDTLVIEVRNTGRLAANARNGVGLDILRRRLNLHYLDRHTFTLAGEEGFVCARLTLEGDPCSV